MRTVFIDTNYWVAILFPRDQWHGHACRARGNLGEATLVTTELVLIEVVNGFSGFGEEARQSVARLVTKILRSRSIETILHTHDAFSKRARSF